MFFGFPIFSVQISFFPFPLTWIISAACAMKPLFWKRIQLSSSSSAPSSQLWEKLSATVIPFEEFESLFAKPERKEKEKKEAVKKPAQKQTAQILDKQRSQTMGILIRSLRFDIEEIQEAVFNMDTANITLENMRTLYDNVSVVFNFVTL